MNNATHGLIAEFSCGSIAKGWMRNKEMVLTLTGNGTSEVKIEGKTSAHSKFNVSRLY